MWFGYFLSSRKADPDLLFVCPKGNHTERIQVTGAHSSRLEIYLSYYKTHQMEVFSEKKRPPQDITAS